MKLTKKLLPALGMLALSACMLVTSTFAWFSMNETVKATNMSVTAKGDQVYLQIINPTSTVDSEKTFTNGAAQTVATANNTNSTILPVNVVNNIDAPVTEGEGEDAVTTYSCTPYAGGNTMMWVTNVGESTTVGTASTTYTDVTTAANTPDEDTGAYKYFIKNTFQVRLDPTAGAESSKPLKVSAIDTTASGKDFQNCLSVLVVATIGSTVRGQVWEYNGTQFVNKTTAITTLSNGDFQANAPATIDIYVFFNGDNVNCTQEKLAAAATANYGVNVSFTVA